LLSKLDTLPPDARGKLALALAPIAARMGIASPADFASADAAVSFWTRFWQDRAIDFKPVLVRRLVTRLAEKSSVLRNEDITQLDTYALPELIRALDRPLDREGVARARRLTLLLAHVTGKPWVVEAEMTPEAAGAVVRRWRRFWLESGADFSNPEGARQVVAMFTETRYSRWLRGFASPPERGPFGVGLTEALRSLVAALTAILVALAVAAELTHWLLERLDQRRRIAGAIVSVVLASAPVAAWGALFAAPEGALGRHFYASLLSGLSAGALLSILSARALLRDADHDRRTAFAHAALALPSVLPWLFTSLLALELGFDLESAGRALLAGLRKGDLHPGMSIALFTALAVAILTSNAPRIAAACAPERNVPALLEVGGSRMRRATLTGFAWFGLLLALTLISLRAGAESANLGSITALARSVAVTSTISLGIAAALGVLLGAIRRNPARALDSLLSRVVEVQAALPAAVWVAAFAATFGIGLRFAIALGALRALDVAWMYRTELVRTTLERREYPTSMRITPDPISFRTRRVLTGPLRAAVAMTPAWALSIVTAMAALAVSAGSSSRILVTPAAFGSAPQALFALGLLSATSAVLLAWAAPLPRKIGAFRASWPPSAPDHFPSEPPPSSRSEGPSSVRPAGES
jgi:hypothetical protein